ncbi:universal stress protein [Tropicimonas aquimaris]|uniref:Universal stress protein n=1 Tax=Tropicimonas aquimaris TaxID=914152 RepID=A0ABW3IPR9_9RHOB
MYSSILLAIDLNDGPSAHKVAEVAFRLAKDHGASLHIVNVIPDFGMSIVGSYFSAAQKKQIIDDERKRFAAWAEEEVPEGISYDLTVVKGSVYDNILRTADKIGADVIVLGSHKPGLEDYLLGPNAARVVRHAKQSVFVVRNSD